MSAGNLPEYSGIRERIQSPENMPRLNAGYTVNVSTLEVHNSNGNNSTKVIKVILEHWVLINYFNLTVMKGKLKLKADQKLKDEDS